MKKVIRCLKRDRDDQDPTIFENECLYITGQVDKKDKTCLICRGKIEEKKEDKPIQKISKQDLTENISNNFRCFKNNTEGCPIENPQSINEGKRKVAEAIKKNKFFMDEIDRPCRFCIQSQLLPFLGVSIRLWYRSEFLRRNHKFQELKKKIKEHFDRRYSRMDDHEKMVLAISAQTLNQDIIAKDIPPIFSTSWKANFR